MRILLLLAHSQPFCAQTHYFDRLLAGFKSETRSQSGSHASILVFMMDSDLILYQFSRSKVERGDFSHFLTLYAPDRLPTGRRLREMMDRIVFCIEGYDEDPREIHSIPEIRRFYSAFHNAWPYWLYFCNLDVGTLKAMVFCCLPSLTALNVDGRDAVAITCDPLDILNFLKQDFVAMNEICDRAEMFEERVYERSKRVFECFGFPFDATPQT